MDPVRVWEEFAEKGLLSRNKDRLARHRQHAGVFDGRVYVLDAKKLFGAAPIKTVVEVGALLKAMPVDLFEDDQYDV
jgi:hypothetical protein